jgi:hypothetical protein
MKNSCAMPWPKLQIIILLFIFSFSTSAAVWVSDKPWTSETNQEFATWMKQEWKKDFFAKKKLSNGESNIFFGLRLDCADTVYSSKIIFSFFKKYNFAINDPTGGKKLVSNSMTRWDHLPEEKRITSFLRYIYNIVSTKSLPNDTYPVALNAEAITPGLLILTTKKNHHSWTIKSILSTGIPHLIFNSTVGAYSGPTLQERKSWPNGEWVFEEDNSPLGHAGIRNWKPDQLLSEPAWKVPGYSEEQYKIKPTAWKKKLQELLQINQETAEQKISRLIENVCNDIKQRVDAVKEASQFFADNQVTCMNEMDFDTYSTPSRDRRLADELVTLRTAYIETLNAKEILTESTLAIIQKIFPFPELSLKEEIKAMTSGEITNSSTCTISYTSKSAGKNKQIDMAELKRRLFLKKLSSNPNDPEEIRFGDSIKGYTNTCPSWGNLELN